MSYAKVPEQREVVLTNVHHGDGGRSGFVYAELFDAKSGDLIINATLDYVLRSITTHNFRLVKRMKVSV